MKQHPAPFTEYGQHNHHWWRQVSMDRDLPAWLRVSAYALGRHRKNGHAHAGPGVLADLLGTPGRPAAASTVWRAIRTATDRMWLEEGSNHRCLIVPMSNVAGGRYGSEYEPCDRHGKPVQGVAS